MLRMPAASAVLAVTAIVSLCFGVGILPYLYGRLRRIAVHLSAMLFADVVFFAAFAALLQANASTARAAYALTTALVILPMGGLVATVSAVARLPRPWTTLPWLYAAVQGGVGLLAGASAYPRVRPVPDGYYLMAVRPTPLWVWDVLGLTLAFFATPAIAWWQRRGPHGRKMRQLLGVWVFCLPLYFNDTVLVAWRHTPYPLTWLPVLVFGVPIWLLLQRQVVETEHRLSRDALTGAASREFLDSWLSEKAEEGGSVPCTLIFLDVDDFKGINDRFGHAAGDAVLRELVRTIQGVLPAGAILARVGGDEFIAATLSAADGEALGAGIRTALAAAGLPRMSMGSVVAPVGGWPQARIAADLRMYADKPSRPARACAATASSDGTA